MRNRLFNTAFDPTSPENRAIQHSSMMTQPRSLVPDAKLSITAYNQVELDHSAFRARANSTTSKFSISSIFPPAFSTITPTGIFAREPATTNSVEEFTTTEVHTSFATVVRPWTIIPGPIGPVTSALHSFRTATSTGFQTFTSASFQTSTRTGQRTITMEQGAVSSQTELPRLAQNSGPSASQTKAIAGGVAGATVVVFLGLVVFCILRRKRRYKAARLALTHSTATSSDVLGQRMRQLTRLTATTRPFLELRATQDCYASKGTVAHHAGSILNVKSRGDVEQAVGDIEQAMRDIEQAVDPFRDPVLAEGSAPNNSDESQRVRNALVRLQAFSGLFEGEFQQLCVLAESGQLSTEDRIRLDEIIRRTTGLTMARGSWQDRSSDIGNASLGSSPSMTPPSYHSRGG